MLWQLKITIRHMLFGRILLIYHRVYNYIFSFQRVESIYQREKMITLLVPSIIAEITLKKFHT